tara:strand:+ start:413 stop:607 length:195 start_codon:yes stop_codon:yes gene_type:complete
MDNVLKTIKTKAVIEQVIVLADLLDQLTKEVAKLQTRIKKIESDGNVNNLLSKSEKELFYGGKK